MLLKELASALGEALVTCTSSLIFRLVTGCVHQPGKMQRSVRHAAVQRAYRDRVSADVEGADGVMHHQLARRESSPTWTVPARSGH